MFVADSIDPASVNLTQLAPTRLYCLK